MIRFDNVTKVYKNGTVAVRNVSLDIQKGEFVFLVGPSGSGKTTCIRMLLREELPDRGRIWVAGREIIHMPKWRVPYLRRNVGCVFQDFRLLPNKTVFQNVAFALEVIGRPKNVVETQVPQVLELVGLAKKRDNLPSELSGGEQQRVAVARAFVNRPLILLADEPTGNLDPGTSQGIMRLLDRINRTGTTVVIATHDAALVDWMRRRVVELDQGTVVRDQARGVYGIDASDRARSRGPRSAARRSCSATLRRLHRPGDRDQPLAQPPDDDRRRAHGGRLAGPGRSGPPAQAGGVQRRGRVAAGDPGDRVDEPGRQHLGDPRRSQTELFASCPTCSNCCLLDPVPGTSTRRPSSCRRRSSRRSPVRTTPSVDPVHPQPAPVRAAGGRAGSTGSPGCSR